MKKNWTGTVCSNSCGSSANEIQDTRRPSRHFVLSARKRLLVEANATPEVYVLNDGWAFRVPQLPNG
jgi:hypothetical protein